eukprot:SAG31_NODE_82_length_27046_cov_45.857275_6_plen_57_part_00
MIHGAERVWLPHQRVAEQFEKVKIDRCNREVAAIECFIIGLASSEARPSLHLGSAP